MASPKALPVLLKNKLSHALTHSEGKVTVRYQQSKQAYLVTEERKSDSLRLPLAKVTMAKTRQLLRGRDSAMESSCCSKQSFVTVASLDNSILERHSASSYKAGLSSARASTEL